ncbi:unnamed protein product [Leuciscus chuanchicus]
MPTLRKEKSLSLPQPVGDIKARLPRLVLCSGSRSRARLELRSRLENNLFPCLEEVHLSLPTGRWGREQKADYSTDPGLSARVDLIAGPCALGGLIAVGTISSWVRVNLRAGASDLTLLLHPGQELMIPTN